MAKVLIVTGGSRGIGEQVVRLAAKKGYAICINYVSNDKRANSLRDELKVTGINVISVQADISVEADVIRLFKETNDALGPVSALVNNAGIIAPLSRLQDMTVERMQHVMNKNVVGSFLCAREAVRSMSTQCGGDGGVIVNLSSMAATLGSPNEFIDYAASKGAIDTLTIGLSKEVANDGIRVNAVRPGLIDTDIHADAGDADRCDKLKANVPMQRVGSPREVAESIIWLLSDAASYVTGAIINVSGGR